jgi:hypothetical protein
MALLLASDAELLVWHSGVASGAGNFWRSAVMEDLVAACTYVQS